MEKRSVRGGRVTTTDYYIARAVMEALRNHLEQVKTLHEKDLAEGYGKCIYGSPFRNIPMQAKNGHGNMSPANQRSVDPRSKVRRHHITDKTIQSAIGVAIKRPESSSMLPSIPSRHSFATHLLMNGVNIRNRTPRPQECRDYNDLHPCHEKYGKCTKSPL